MKKENNYILLVLAMLANTLDIISTWFAIANGATELNPLAYIFGIEYFLLFKRFFVNIIFFIYRDKKDLLIFGIIFFTMLFVINENNIFNFVI